MLPSRESIFFGLAALAICFITTDSSKLSENWPNGICGQNLSDPTGITTLNDDCLYETFAYLDLEDLNALIQTNGRFVSIGRYIFRRKSIEMISDLRKRQIKNRYFTVDPKVEDMALDLIGAFAPTIRSDDDHFNDHKIVLFFKFISALSLDYDLIINMSRFVDVLKPYVEMTMGKENHIEEFADTLTVYDHFAIHRHVLANFFNAHETSRGWMCYAYMMVLEKSKQDLRNEFTYAMMESLDRLRNAANAFSLLYHETSSGGISIKEHLLKYFEKIPFKFGFPSWNKPKVENIKEKATFEYQERFKLDWDLYKGQSPSETSKQKFHLTLAQNEIRTLHQMYFWEEAEPYFARVYCAIRSLDGLQFIKLVDATDLNLAAFDTGIKNEIVKKLRNSLETECVGAAVLNKTGLQQQISDLDKLTGQRVGKYLVHLKEKDVKAKFYNKISENINVTPESLAMTDNFSDYIKLLKTWIIITRFDPSPHPSIFMKMFFYYFTFVDRPSAFDNADQLNEIDRLHTELFNRYPYEIRLLSTSVLIEHRCEYLLKAALNNFDSILSSTNDDSPETRNKQRIVLKILILLANMAYNDRPRNVVVIGGEEYENIVKIIKMFYSLTTMDGEAIARDGYLLYHWNKFNSHMHTNVRRLYLQTDMTNGEFSTLYQPYQPTGDLTTDAFAYLCALNIVKNMAILNETIPEQLFENILTLEESIGEADTAEPQFREEILTKKFKFYERFVEEVREKQEKRNLKRFVESSIDLLLNQASSKCEIKILRSIYVAVQNNRETAREQLGSELIEKLSQLSFDDENAFGFNQIKSDYEAFREILQIKNSIAWQD